MMQKVTSPPAFSDAGVSEKVEPRGNTRFVIPGLMTGHGKWALADPKVFPSCSEM